MRKAVIEGVVIEGVTGFEWPEFTKESDRIKHNTEAYKHLSIEESFAQAYGLKLNKQTPIQEYKELQLGDMVKLKVMDVNKKGVIFDQENYKENIVCDINLYQYPNFRKFIPKQPIECKIIGKDHNKVVVDPFAGMLDAWYLQHTQIAQQYHMSEDRSILIKNLRQVRGGFMGSVVIDTISELCGKEMYVEAFIPGSQIVLNIEYDFASWNGKDVRAFVTNYSAKPGSANKILICSRKEYLKHDGNVALVQIFKDYTEENERWTEIHQCVQEGIVTGVCHTASKCGVFVEIPSLNVTGMIPIQDPSKLTQYLRGSKIDVCIDRFDELMKYNDLAGQMQHVEPYIINDNILQRCNLKCIFAEVKSLSSLIEKK